MKTDRLLPQHQSGSGFLATLRYDFPAGVAVFLVSLPLCLGIALASGAPLFSGVIAGIVGGIVVGLLSGSALGVSGPAAGLTVLVLAAIQELGFEGFLLAAVVAGIFQVVMGIARAGIVGYYFPTAVISGMLSGIGIILFLKQIPHAVGYDRDYEGDIAFHQADAYTTFSELSHMVDFVAPGAILITGVSLVILILWERPFMRSRRWVRLIPRSLVAVVVGILIDMLLQRLHPEYALAGNHLVNLPVIDGIPDLMTHFTIPDFSQITNGRVYVTALTLAVIASLETLLSVEAIDKLDPEKRVTPTNRELIAQGIGNIGSGLIGGLPVTQVVVRSSANQQAGAKSKAATVIHGILLLITVLLIPQLLNKMPLASLAAILLVVGYKLAQPELVRRMYKAGPYHFIPYVATILGLLLTDLLTGVGIGMAIALFCILLENYKTALYFHEEHKGNKIFIRLSENVSFLNKANILRILDRLPDHSEVVIDATDSRYIDYDVFEIIQNFKAEARRKGITLVIENLRGYGSFEPVSNALPQTQETQKSLTPAKVLELLKEGNKRFVYNLKANRNTLEQVNVTQEGQFPMAIILSCIDSRTSVELIFDQGLGDVFSTRIAGNIVNDDILGCMEFACKLAGSKLIVVLGHSHCGAIKGACDDVRLDHLTGLLAKIKPAVDSVRAQELVEISKDANVFVQKVAERNVQLVAQRIREESPVLEAMAEKGEVGIVGAMYDIETGKVEFYESGNRCQETGDRSRVEQA
jgi:carbonic anhydrase